MRDWIAYKWGIYRIVGGYIELYCVFDKPIVPKGIKPDYSRFTLPFIYKKPDWADSKYKSFVTYAVEVES